ncbi:MAG: acyltransferase [Chloroflexi bacterium]|nr:MAG: acyltransferase [Chloroflexota bacterium]
MISNSSDDSTLKPMDIGNAIPRRGNKLSQAIAQRSMSLFGWEIKGHVPNLSKMVLVGAPHTSNWDFILTICTMFALGIQLNWLAKDSLFRNPFGGIFRYLGGIGVNRRVSTNLVDAVVNEFKKRESIVLAIMPEGTRSKVRRWKTGFYYMATQASVPILLITFDYGRKIMKIGPAINPTGDIETDLPHIQSYFKDIKAKNPDKYGS